MLGIQNNAHPFKMCDQQLQMIYMNLEWFHGDVNLKYKGL